MIRPASAADRAAVVALADRLADFELPPGRTAREIQVADHHLFDAQFAAPSPDVLFLVAEEDGEVLGTIFVNTRSDYFTRATVAYVEVLAVSETAAGKGIGRALMAETEGWARARGLSRVELAVFANNRRARAFYEHLGYQAETMRYVKQLGGERPQGRGSPERA
ncbi:MAG TPA: GNAT family N-acetyltransferase [Gemmatimonadales bacterium]|nr:GNAT family N-acetyltransferase [Gemmatimonadales bacterium]